MQKNKRKTKANEILRGDNRFCYCCETKEVKKEGLCGGCHAMMTVALPPRRMVMA